MAIRFKNVPSALGLVRVSFDDATAQVLGIFQMVPGRTGVIDGDLLNVVANLDGNFQLNASRTGTIQAALAAVAANIDGNLGAPQGQRVVYAQADFNNGIADNTPGTRTDLARLNNGLNFGAVARNQGGGYGSLKGATGNVWNENGLYDVRMMPSVTIGPYGGLTDVVGPRAGARMLHSVCYRGQNPVDGEDLGGPLKHYETINGDPAGTHTDKCKPRTFFGPTDDGYMTPYDTKHFGGISIYTPRYHENENTRQVGTISNGPMFVEANIQGDAQDADATTWSLHQLVPSAAQGWRMPNGNLVPAGVTDTWWCLVWENNGNSTTQGGGSNIALAPLLPHTDPNSDRGKWTDFVFELRYNPYAVQTTVAGWNFRPNTGYMKIYKSSGPVSGTPHYQGGNGDRTISAANPLYTTPAGGFGLRPTSAGSCPTFQIKHYCFFLRGEVPTGRTHPIHHCFDEYRVGFAENKVHARAVDSNLVANHQSRASTFNDVVPRAAG